MKAEIATLAAALGLADFPQREVRKSSFGKTIPKEERDRRKKKKKLAKASKKKNR